MKGLVVGYPLSNMNEHTLQCQYVERFIEYMWTEERVRLPVTLVNEYNSSMEAKARIAHIVQQSISQAGAEQRRLLELEKSLS